MELRLLGWPEDGPRLDLDHERFAYAGHFGTGRTGLAVALAADAGDGVASADASAGNARDLDAASADEPGSASDPSSLRTDRVLAAASFDPDRAAERALRVRYVAVREDRRGAGIGPRLLRFVVERAGSRGFDRVRIGVNNPVAYEACYRAGFAFVGEESGMGALVLEAPAVERSTQQYRDGLARFEDRDLPPTQRSVLERHLDGEPPPRVD